jgi:hypothetical protein
VPSATAILDRFLHHAEIVSITGKSYRLRNQAADASKAPSIHEPEKYPVNLALLGTSQAMWPAASTGNFAPLMALAASDL